jgi:5'-3' exonuclease
MGIRGLHTCLIKTVPYSITTVDWTEWRGKRLGIDIQCFLYRAIANQLKPLEVIANQIAKFKGLGITPVYIFDGKPPEEKNPVNVKRRADRQEAVDLCEELRASLDRETDTEIRDSLVNKIHDLESRFPILTYETKDEIKKFLYATGTMFISPSCEADTLLAYWYRRSVLDAVVSLDLDFLPRGCRLFVPKHIGLGPGDVWSDYNPVTICSALRLTQRQFVEFCVLLGSDYTPNLPIVPWKFVLQNIQRKESMESIWSKHTFCNWRKSDSNSKLESELDLFRKAAAILNGESDSVDCLMESVQWAKWNAGIQDHEEATLDEFRRANADWNSEWWTLFTQKNCE